MGRGGCPQLAVRESPLWSAQFPTEDDHFRCDSSGQEVPVWENTRVTEDANSLSLSGSPRPGPGKFSLNESLKKLVTFAEKFDVIFQMISESSPQDSGSSHPNAVAFDILRLKFLENEKGDCDFSVLAHKMLAVDSTKYQIVKVGNYDRVGLEIRRLVKDGLLLLTNSRPASFRKFFKERLLGMVMAFHIDFLQRIGLPAYNKSVGGWHPAFSLDDFYRHLNYEPAETPEYRRALELIKQRQETINRNGELSKERSAELRQKIYRSLQANEKSMTSSSPLDKEGRQINTQIAPEVAMKLKILFRIKRVSNMFLANVLKNFQNKAVFSLFVDEGELSGVIQYIGERAPQWLTLASNPGGTIVKINPNLDMDAVLSLLKTGDG